MKLFSKVAAVAFIATVVVPSVFAKTPVKPANASKPAAVKASTKAVKTAKTHKKHTASKKVAVKSKAVKAKPATKKA